MKLGIAPRRSSRVCNLMAALVERCPVEDAQTQVDRSCIEGINSVGQVQPKILLAVKLASTANEQGRKIGPDAPVSRFVGIRQGRTMDCTAQAHRIELVGVGAECHLDIAQALAPSQLSKRHDAELLGTGQPTRPRVARVAIHDPRKTRPGDELHNLCKQRLADIHGSSPRLSIPGNYTIMRIRTSNRHQSLSAYRPRHHWLSTKQTPA